MKTKLILLVLGIALIAGVYCCKDGYGGTFSEGYQMGNLQKLSTKGFIFKSGEGELYMGNGSSTVSVEKGSGDDKVTKQINPRLFSMDASQVSQYAPYEGKFVVMEYKQYRFKGWNRHTDYEPVAITEVVKNDSSMMEAPYETTKASGNYSEGSRIGRFVKASKKGNVVKSYEVIIQIGNEGSAFMNMSVNDQGLYNRIIQYMTTASVAKISYKQKLIRNAIAEDTPYEIYRIEPYTAPTLSAN